MAGSELDGLDGADATMFNGAVWVLTPARARPTPRSAWSPVRWRLLGAEMVAMTPEHHDEMVAMVSHVPHLTAASLMGLAADGAEEHAALLRLAAGGFRDMTRIASGHPDIWLDICDQNRPAIVDGLDRLIAGLSEMRDIVSATDREGLSSACSAPARPAATCPAGSPGRSSSPRCASRSRTVSAPPREIFTLAAQHGINIASFEVVHLAESNVGVAVVLVDAEAAERYRAVLVEHGYHPAVTKLA